MKGKEIWDKVYKQYPPSKLPWYKIPFSTNLKDFLKGLDKKGFILVVDCGVGDTAEQISKSGFTNVLGTDISSEAISTAQKRFPHIKFKCIGTEELYKEDYQNVNVVDWLNLHQITPNILPNYLSSLNKISKSLFLAYFYDPKRPSSQKSIITGDLIYNHKPNDVSLLLNNMAKTQEFVSYTGTNKEFGHLDHKFRTVEQIYRKN